MGGKLVKLFHWFYCKDSLYEKSKQQVCSFFTYSIHQITNSSLVIAIILSERDVAGPDWIIFKKLGIVWNKKLPTFILALAFFSKKKSIKRSLEKG